ncbi:MAG: tetratricopeptide repeat protein, partial [Myxococcota bacterium]
MALNKRKVLDAARKNAQKGAKAKALKEYNKLLNEDPRDAKLLLEVGDAYRRWGQNEEAVAQYGKVAQQYRQDGFDARAVAVFKQILNLDAKNYGAYVSLSELYQRMGLDSEAVAALQAAADGYHKEGRKTEALDLLRQMAALDPTNTTSRLKVAELLRQEDMEDEAVAEYEAVVAELENQDDREQLVTVLERLLEIQPDKIDALTGLARQLMLAGELDRAEPIAVHALSVDASAPQFELLMDLYAQMGDDAKLADATRGLAKVYRDRGDQEKARELMQRLPVEEVGSSSRLAVDVSEVAESVIDEDEFLADDEPFFCLDGALSETAQVPDLADEPLLELGGDLAAEPETVPETGSEAEVSLPEGAPDQLLAEANVYLRYGKQDQAIASLRGILVQEPNHRAALEKLGDAYANGGQHSEAVQLWLRAAEVLRVEGDVEGLSLFKDRIAALDPGLAEQLGTLAPGVPPELDAPGVDLERVGSELDAPEIHLELDVEADLDLDLDLVIDDGEDEGDEGETETGHDFGAEDDDFEIELDEDSITFDAPFVQAGLEHAPEPTQEETHRDLELADEVSFDGSLDAETGDDFDFDFEIEGGDLGGSTPDAIGVPDADEALSIDFDEGQEAVASLPTGSVTGEESSTTESIAEDLEEAGFYISQRMYDEARGILERVLEQAPNHPAALLRLGEIAASQGESVDASSPPEGDGSQSAQAGLEIITRFDDDDFEVEVDFCEGEEFEVEVDFDDEDDLEGEIGLEDSVDLESEAVANDDVSESDDEATEAGFDLAGEDLIGNALDLSDEPATGGDDGGGELDVDIELELEVEGAGDAARIDLELASDDDTETVVDEVPEEIEGSGAEDRADGLEGSTDEDAAEALEVAVDEDEPEALEVAVDEDEPEALEVAVDEDEPEALEVTGDEGQGLEVTAAE